MLGESTGSADGQGSAYSTLGRGRGLYPTFAFTRKSFLYQLKARVLSQVFMSCDERVK